MHFVSYYLMCKAKENSLAISEVQEKIHLFKLNYTSQLRKSTRGWGISDLRNLYSTMKNFGRNSNVAWLSRGSDNGLTVYIRTVLTFTSSAVLAVSL